MTAQVKEFWTLASSDEAIAAYRFIGRLLGALFTLLLLTIKYVANATADWWVANRPIASLRGWWYKKFRSQETKAENPNRSDSTQRVPTAFITLETKEDSK